MYIKIEKRWNKISRCWEWGWLLFRNNGVVIARSDNYKTRAGVNRVAQCIAKELAISYLGQL